MTRPSLVVVLMGALFASFGETGAHPSQPSHLTDYSAQQLFVETVLGSAEHPTLSLHELAGKTIVLELWATWCAPCVESLPAWNRLVEHFAGQDVVFVALTDENSPRKLRSFLADHPIRGHVGIDRDRSLFEAFDVDRIPSTTVISPEGIVYQRLAGLPSTEQLAAVVRGDSVVFESDEAPTSRTFRAVRAAEFYFVEIQASDGQRLERSFHPSGKYHSKGDKLWQLASFAYREEGRSVTLAEALPPERYDVDIECAAGLSCVRAALRIALAQSFGIMGTTEDLERDVWVLHARPAGLGSSLRPADPDNPPEPKTENDFLVVDASTDHLAGLIQRWLGQPVVNETGLEGSFDGTLRCQLGDPDSVKVAVEEQWGLALKKELRVVPTTVIRLDDDGAQDCSTGKDSKQISGGGARQDDS